MTGASVSIERMTRSQRQSLGVAWVRGALDRDWVWLSCIALLGALQVALITSHTPWLDEWQALLIAVQSPDFAALLEHLRYEGHPPLWYGLLLAWSAGVPFEYVLPAAALTVAFALHATILLRAPFPRAERLLLCLGEIALFEYGTIARSLALGALAMVAVAALWHRREVWLALAVLPMCDFLFGVVALLLIALRIRDRNAPLGGLALFGASALLAAWTVRPAGDVVPAEASLALAVEFTDYLQRLGGLILPYQTFLGRVAWDGFPPFLLGVPLGALFLVWMWKRYAADPWQRGAMFALLAICLALSATVYPLHFRHLTVNAWLMVVLTWIAPPAPPAEKARWRWWLAVGAACGLASAATALSRPFDAAPEVAAAMRRLDDGKTRWMAFPPSRIPALAAYTRAPLISPGKGCSETFVRWNHEHGLRKPAALRRSLSQWSETYGRSFLILERLPRNVPRDVFLPLTGTMRGYDGQRYLIGVLGPTRAPRPFSPPPCVTGLRPLS